jgi:hypothetical protein
VTSLYLFSYPPEQPHSVAEWQKFNLWHKNETPFRSSKLLPYSEKLLLFQRYGIADL